MHNNTFQSLGLLILRVAVGVIFVANDWRMLTQWGVSGTAVSLASSGIPMASFVAIFSILAELVGGVLFILGLGTRLIGLAYLAISLGAIYFVHWAKGIYVAEGGFEYVMLLGACGLLFVLIGPGKFSIDHMVAKAFRKKKQNRAVENHVVDAEPVAAYSA
ncbi:DoxX family protein [Rothia terrae]|uniref:DoxX family protein n=1 Tax=Rothia terrae TaxID=396015 RepID=UPI003827C910